MYKWTLFDGNPRVQLHPVECHARNLVPLAEKAYAEGVFVDIATCVPNYLKAPNITSAS
jgi:hypothetical protein